MPPSKSILKGKLIIIIKKNKLSVMLVKKNYKQKNNLNLNNVVFIITKSGISWIKKISMLELLYVIFYKMAISLFYTVKGVHEINL